VFESVDDLRMMTSFEGFDTVASSNLPRPERLAQGVITNIYDKKDILKCSARQNIILYILIEF
jgi:hypothetical protein